MIVLRKRKEGENKNSFSIRKENFEIWEEKEWKKNREWERDSKWVSEKERENKR